MTVKKSITVEQKRTRDNHMAIYYSVIQSVNILTPKVGDRLTKVDTQNLIDVGGKVTVKGRR